MSRCYFKQINGAFSPVNTKSYMFPNIHPKILFRIRYHRAPSKFQKINISKRRQLALAISLHIW